MDDHNLVKRSLDGNDQAFEILVQRYQNYIYSICYGVIQDVQEAENLAQETFLQVYRSLSYYQYKSFKSWIGTIALRKSIDYKRKKQKENTVVSSLLEEVDLPSKENSVEGQIIEKEQISRLQRLWNQLPIIYNSVLKKYYLQSKSYSQIAKEEDISVKTVESRLYRAKKIIEKKWKEDGDEAF